MRMRLRWALPAGFALTWAAGCAGPVVKVSHVLPAAVPMPAGVVLINPRGTFTVTPPDAGLYGQFVIDLLNERPLFVSSGQLRAARVVTSEIQPEQVVFVGGRITIKADDARGARQVRRPNATTREPELLDLPTLVRTVELTVDFVLTRAHSGEQVTTVETHRSYSSTADPRVRGELGLHRPDDPQRIPPADQVIRELLTECAETFRAMVLPLVVTAEIPMRGTLNEQGRYGLKAAEQGAYQNAVGFFESAVKQSPNDVSLLFNLAVACEAAGRLADAARHYQTVADRTQARDPHAAEAAQRVQRVLARAEKSDKAAEPKK
ncbi:MAG TPA: tetratricopeptide repeat protein [Phycisphaerae bacterium]|nr:tetratricopeptide repeat protein [Phycisphaerae bacterium]